MRDAGQRLTSVVKVSVVLASGSTEFNLHVSRSDAIIAQFAPPWSWPAKRAFFLLCRGLHNELQVCVARSRRTNRVGLNGYAVGVPASGGADRAG